VTDPREELLGRAKQARQEREDREALQALRDAHAAEAAMLAKDRDAETRRASQDRVAAFIGLMLEHVDTVPLTLFYYAHPVSRGWQIHESVTDALGRGWVLQTNWTSSGSYDKFPIAVSHPGLALFDDGDIHNIVTSADSLGRVGINDGTTRRNEFYVPNPFAGDRGAGLLASFIDRSGIAMGSN
jgi:hypothetical protein